MFRDLVQFFILLSGILISVGAEAFLKRFMIQHQMRLKKQFWPPLLIDGRKKLIDSNTVYLER